MKLLVILALALAVCAERQFHGDQVLRTFPTQEKLELFKQLEAKYEIEFWTDLGVKAPVDIHVRYIFLNIVKAALDNHNVRYEIFVEDMQRAVEEQTDRSRIPQMSLASFDYNVYHTGDEISQWISNMASSYSDASVFTVGQTYEGRTIQGLKISSGGRNKPAFVINCGIHAREWVGPASCMYATKYLLEGSSYSNYRSQVDYYIIPSSNPDGYDYTWTGDRMWRKTRSKNAGYVCDGVDPNRNFDVNWSGPGASSSSCNDAFYGPSAMSEIEVVNLSNLLSSISNVKAFIDIHAYSQYWMFPYAYSYSYTPDHAFLTQVGDESVAAIKAVHGKSYTSGSISEVIYQASGSTVDYTYINHGIKCSFAAELRDTGRYGFLLPESQIQPTSEESFAGLMVIAGYVANGQC